ncbi:hypothetical protein EYF80_059549 [Liparis tanakae]|uniref:Uncharacterized protein n=1 Tax=Liparis tanakae TaxID=230148 RepID=A0A4Z2ENH0_9TELE|nr:hypothetical protein EYF80_059549 [Liparis tanakae]
MFLHRPSLTTLQQPPNPFSRAPSGHSPPAALFPSGVCSSCCSSTWSPTTARLHGHSLCADITVQTSTHKQLGPEPCRDVTD